MLQTENSDDGENSSKHSRKLPKEKPCKKLVFRTTFLKDVK